MKKIIFVLFSSFFFILNLSAQNLEDIVNKKYVDELKSKGSISIVHPKKENIIEMVPVCTYSEQIKSNLLSANGSGVPFLAEFLYLIPKSELTDDVSKVNIDSVSIVFRSVSKMEGMKYIHNGGKTDVLYSKAYVIENTQSDNPIADPLGDDIKVNGLEIYAYQKDHTFGNTKYKLNYHLDKNTLFATFLNTIPMSKLGVKAVMPENLRTNVLCIDIGDSLLLYLSADVNAKNIVGIRNQIEDSMTVRMDAIYRWFMVQFK